MQAKEYHSCYNKILSVFLRFLWYVLFEKQYNVFKEYKSGLWFIFQRQVDTITVLLEHFVTC